MNSRRHWLDVLPPDCRRRLRRPTHVRRSHLIVQIRWTVLFSHCLVGTMQLRATDRHRPTVLRCLWCCLCVVFSPIFQLICCVISHVCSWPAVCCSYRDIDSRSMCVFKSGHPSPPDCWLLKWRPERPNCTWDLKLFLFLSCVLSSSKCFKKNGTTWFRQYNL